MPAEVKKKCFCCNKLLTARARLEHRKIYFAGSSAALATTSELAPNTAPEIADLDSNPAGDVVPANADGQAAGEELGPTEETNEFEDLLNTFADVSMDNEPDLPTPPPQLLPQAQGLRTNPPVTIEEWPELDEVPEEMVPDEDDPVPVDDPNQDPAFDEEQQPAMFDPINEPLLTDEEMLEILEMELGDLEDTDEWHDMYTRLITTRDRTILQFLATRLRTHFSRQTYDDLRHGACAELNIPSEFVAWRRLRILSNLESHAYDCCINSCVCFVGRYRNLTSCPYCKEGRLNSNGYPRRRFRYSPLIPQLRALFQDPDMAKNLGYRALCDMIRENGVIQDVFDAKHYLTLRETLLDPAGDYCFFDDPRDIALGVSTDGVTLFKRRRRGLSTAWPILIINYNLHPRIRNRLENVLCVGVIPGPRQCKDLNSFLCPLLDELLELESGVSCASPPGPDGRGSDFVFHAFLIMMFGDIPAVAKLLMMKGHNAFKPCRACLIPGVLCQLERNSVYYVPLALPGQERVLTYTDLPLRTHQQLLDQLAQMEAAPTQARRKELARQFGLNSRSVFTHLRSINMAICAPYDAMHLLFENLVPNMIKLWTGKFKGLDQGSGNYELEKDVWVLVGKLTAAVLRTVPSSFVGTMPDIAQDESLYKAEAYSFWFIYIAPIVLKGRLKEPYYAHMILMRNVIKMCLLFEITHADIDQLQTMINKWVADYERLYYQYQYDRLPACPLTIHALLHMPSYIRQTGPLWASWAFVMERFCGHLLPAVKNRTLPYPQDFT
ncbi:transposase family Tnp2 protein [Rhizoctonia solani AG-3 Rhs1AP]|uniref:Transposase family Tnp2 protein n=2 Tax=Rhizoctonia solani AG-3 TaxID=1086053 RepID=A0A074RM27_9AGAM|nr:transposase family Tnp2 protein [Rhizoctonia solani AG-3 Rhs1AP]KEP48146.1 transposase family Tnp2 protein [Rhizoctonia solani 123E]